MIRILILEYSEEDAFLLARELQRGESKIEFEVASEPSAWKKALAQGNWDIIVSDFQLGPWNAFDALEAAREAGAGHIPFILVSGKVGEETAAQAIKKGAADYIDKSKLSRLNPAIERELREASRRRLHQETEAVFRREEKRYRALIEHSWDAVVLLSPEGNVLFASPATTRIMSYSPEELGGINAFPRIHPDDQNSVREALDQSLRRPGEVVFAAARALHKNGSWRHLESTFINLTGDPSIEAIICNYRDATERKQAEEQVCLQASMLNQVRNGVIGTGLDGNILFWNRHCENLFLWPAAEALGRNALTAC